MKTLSVLAALALLPMTVAAQAADMSSSTFRGLEMRNIGPALMSGRIADIVIMPDDPATWYVAVGSGGVWKTNNAGTTWTPIFDSEASYSIGALAVDPSNRNTIWVGTGENVGGRHVGFGDGIYRSQDGGASWEHLGLEKSEHISKIIVHPKDPNTVWVAAQGPLWSRGGERGLYKTTDGGKRWRKVLSAGAWTGVTDVVMDPRDPDRLYAATWQRHRSVAAYMGGGPESGIHVSEDGGNSWKELTSGLPRGNKGKIGLAISPSHPDVLYAAIETDRRTGGIWRSNDRGASWERRNNAVGAGTGPHYYQEIYVSPHDVNRVYLVSNVTRVSADGGYNFGFLSTQNKHVDDHAIAFRPDDPNYILVGSDGGLYESYDGERSWRFIDNLPVTQFYKVAVDDAEPFYNVYGGTQDNNTQGGPSRTDNLHGIRNSDWFTLIFGDGHQPATEPGNPDIVYAQWQQGNLTRTDRTTGEFVYIQPQPKPGDDPERFNWDAPILVSSHDPKRLYHASQRVWRSDDRGDSWQAISSDLTRDEDRMNLSIMGRKWSWDAPWDVLAMSKYNTVTSLAESPLNENLLYAGTDDGIIQVTEDGGQSWRKIEAGSLPGVPDTAFVNDIKADLHDENTVYIALDNHKYGDYKPYLLKSTDRGRRWRSIAGNMPDNHLVWRVVQDHVKPGLMFAGTEFGVFFTVDGGGKWVELTGGVPTISFRDLAIQRRETDLVGASFGRGFFILDDYSPLREVSEDALKEEALLFPGRKAWWYMPRHPLGFSGSGSQGHGFYRAPNPDFGAVFTYYLSDGLQSLQSIRQASERGKKNTPFPGFEAIEQERRETAPEIWLTIRDSDGTVVRRLKGPTHAGFHRIAWDLSFPSANAVAGASPSSNNASGFFAAPGTYTVSLSKRVRGKTTELVGPQEFTVERLRKGALDGAEPAEVVAFWEELSAFTRSTSAALVTFQELNAKVGILKTALERTRTAPSKLDDDWQAIRDELFAIEEAFDGIQSKEEVGELKRETVLSRLGKLQIGVGFSTYGPTKTHLEMFGYAKQEFAEVRARLAGLRDESIPALEAALADVGGPWVPGAPLPAGE